MFHKDPECAEPMHPQEAMEQGKLACHVTMTCVAGKCLGCETALRMGAIAAEIMQPAYTVNGRGYANLYLKFGSGEAYNSQGRHRISHTCSEAGSQVPSRELPLKPLKLLQLSAEDLKSIVKRAPKELYLNRDKPWTHWVAIVVAMIVTADKHGCLMWKQVRIPSQVLHKVWQ